MKSFIDSCWIHFPKSHLLVTSGLTVCLSATLALWPSKHAEAIRSLNFEDASALPEQNLLSPSGQELSTNLESLNSSTQDANAILVPEVEQAIAVENSELNSTPVPSLPWQEVTVKSGDNLTLIFHRAGLSDREVYLFVSGSEQAKELTKLRPGETLEMQINADQHLASLRYQPNRLVTHTFDRQEQGFDFNELVRTPETQSVFRTATIDSSLFLAGTKAGMDDGMIMETANIFGWDIDFVLDIRQGDSFKVLYEEQYLDGEKFANGNILAAEFINQGKTYRAVRYTDSKGDSQYFTPDGQSMRKEFLRTPVDFARISSPFNLNRKHPVLNTIRAHKGTDYAAPTGTPIRAVGDGKVIFAGRNGGYGNVVTIQHGQTYQTRYAHMSKFQRGVRQGTSVKQGQIIGYVGSTGLATGPHLHYEFYVNGAVRNPVTVALPKAKSVPEAEMLRFAQQTQPLLAELGYMANTQLALKDDFESVQ